MTAIDVNDLLAEGAKVPAAKFESIGDAVAGTIAEVDARQCLVYGTTDLDWWDTAKTEPKMQVVITLQTDQRDASIEDDDGRRRVYAKKPSKMLTAIATALGGRRLEVGGRLAVKFTDEEPHKNPAFNAIKGYAAAYEPPASNAAADLLASETSAAASESATQPPADVADLL